MIPFLDLTATYDELKDEIDAAVARTLASGFYIGGEETNRFEQEFAAFCAARHCIGVGNGLDALHIALAAMDIGPGDEVIVSSNTFIATWLAVSMVGATPVPVEPDPRTYNLDPDKVEAAITSRTRAVLPTHLYGQPADLDPLLRIARENGLKVLEDAAQAHGARYKGRRIGAHGDAVAWSFYPGKNLGAYGDGGAVTTNDPALAERIRQIGNYGSSQKYVHDVRGVNSRLDPIQAAVLRVKLAHLEAWNARRAQVADLYRTSLQDVAVTLPYVPQWAAPSWHLFVIEVDRRDAVQAALAERGAQTLIHYPTPPHLQKAYSAMGLGEGAFPIAERLAHRALSLPIGPHLPLKDAAQVAELLSRVVASA